MSKCSGDKESDTRPVNSTASVNALTGTAQLTVSAEQY